jgi:hypothetical protein
VFWTRPGTTENALAYGNTTGGGNDVAISATARLFADLTDENRRIGL